MKELINLIHIALENTHRLCPDFNPMKGHTYQDAHAGSSRFRKIITHVGDLTEFINSHKPAFMMIPGKAGAVCLIAEFGEVVGEMAYTRPIDENKYVIKKDHGDLIATGKAITQTTLTPFATLVFTPEKINGSTVFCLASTYPGVPDKEGNWEGIKEGDVLTGKELFDRGITRVKDI